MEKNKKVSKKDPINEEIIGATNHFLFLSLSKICTSNNCAIINAPPDPIAILIEINLKNLLKKIMWKKLL